MATTRTCGRRPTRREGAVILEFAFVAIVLVFIMLGMIETSRGVMVKEALNNAARSGCRYATTGKVDNAAVQAEINAILQANNLTASDATITILVNGKAGDVKDADHYDKITVTVSMPVSKVYWVSALFLSTNSSVSEYCTMMMQG